MTVGTSHDHVEWNPTAIRQYGGFQPLFAAINRTPFGSLAATRRFGETAIGRHIIQVEADHPVILIQLRLVQRHRQSRRSPFTHPAANRAIRTGWSRNPFVATPVDQGGNHMIEHRSIREPMPVTADGVIGMHHRTIW